MAYLRPRKRETDAGSHSSAGGERRSAAQHSEGGDEAVHCELELMSETELRRQVCELGVGSPFYHSRRPQKHVRHVSAGLQTFEANKASVCKDTSKQRARGRPNFRAFHLSVHRVLLLSSSPGPVPLILRLE